MVEDGDGEHAAEQREGDHEVGAQHAAVLLHRAAAPEEGDEDDEGGDDDDDHEGGGEDGHVVGHVPTRGLVRGVTRGLGLVEDVQEARLVNHHPDTARYCCDSQSLLN